MSQVGMREEDVRRQLYGANDPWERKTSSLVPKARILHAILFNCILPRAGSRHLVTTLDEQCLFYLLNRNPIDLPFLIFHYMIKGMKDSNSYPYGMLLTRIFKESGIVLHRGYRRTVHVKSKIDAHIIRRMGLNTVIKKEADSSRRTMIEGESATKKTPASSSEGQVSMRSPADEIRKLSGRPLIKQASPQIEESQSQRTEQGGLKRQGESLLIEATKKAKRSRRIGTVRRQEEKKSREQIETESSPSCAPTAKKSLVSIREEDTGRKTKETKKKRKGEGRREKAQVKKTGRVTEAVRMTVREVSGKKEISDAAQKEKPNEQSRVQEIPFKQPVELNLLQPTPVNDQPEVTTDSTSVRMPVEVSAESSLIVHEYSEFLRKDKLEVRLVEIVRRRSSAIAIFSQPRREIKAVFQPILINSESWHILNEDERNFYDTLRYAGTRPYPTQMSSRPCTIYPVTEHTIIKVVPDIQPRYPLNFNKGKSKLFPEEDSDDLSADQIAEEVRKINEACVSTQNKDDASCSYTDKQEDCPVGGRIITGTFIESLVQTVLRIRPLSNTLSIQAEALPLQGRQLLMLPAPFDLDLPEADTFIRPPSIVLNEEYTPTSDAYTTTIPFIVPSADEDQSSLPSDSQDELSRLRGEVNEMKETINDLKKMMTELLKSRRP